MRLSVVIPHYYRERGGNLNRIVESLCTGSVWPEEVIIWNNESEPVQVAPVRGVQVLVVQSPRNVGAQARLLAAIMARGQYVLFLDNDVCVRRHTIMDLLAWAVRRPDQVVTLEGRERPTPETPYSRWPKVYGHGLREPRQVFLSLGRGEMVRRDVLLSVLGSFPFSEATVMDDLWLSACYEKHGVAVYVVPSVRGASDLEDLPMGGVGLCKQSTFTEDRNRVAIVIASDMEALKAQAESA